MRNVEPRTLRCLQPHCGGQLLVHHEPLLWGFEERRLVCSLCGREWKAPARAAAPRVAEAPARPVVQTGRGSGS